MPLDPSHPIPPSRVNVHAKSGGEGAAVFDSSIALLQGMFPPTPSNKIDLANGLTVVAPLGGYQYVPVEMTEGGDHVLEPWTDCKVRMPLAVSRGYSSTPCLGIQETRVRGVCVGRIHTGCQGCETFFRDGP